MSNLLPLKTKALALAGLFLSLFIGSTVFATSASALTGCRSDPVLTLSNGVSLTLYEDITDSPSDVTKITYQVHVPVGVTVKSVLYLGPIPANLQTVTTSADENAGNYDAYTTVSTATPNIPVTAYMSASGPSGTIVSTHTSGHSGQLQHSHLHLS